MRKLKRRFGALIVAAACTCSGLAEAAYVYNAGAAYAGDTPLSLNSDGLNHQDFAAVLRQGGAKPRVGVILLHGRGENTFDGHVILPLRLELNTIGYTTLSIDIPVPQPLTYPNPFAYQKYQADANGANYVFPELYARVRAATAELRARGMNEVVLVGFSLGSRLGSAYLRYGDPISLPIPAIGYIGVGMASDGVAQLLDTPTSLGGVTVPVLDMYGFFDNPTVLSSATARMDAYGGPSYTQFLQQGARHQWVGYEPQLVGEATTWLNDIAPVAAVAKPGNYAKMLQAFGTALRYFGLPRGIVTSLGAKIDAAASALRRGDRNAARGSLLAFGNEVEAQRGKKIAEPIADRLLDRARQLLEIVVTTAFESGPAPASPRR